MTIIVGFTSFVIGFIACVLFVPGIRIRISLHVIERLATEAARRFMRAYRP